MFKKFIQQLLNKTPAVASATPQLSPIKKISSIFSTEFNGLPEEISRESVDEALRNQFKLTGKDFLARPAGAAMDESASFLQNGQDRNVSELLTFWYLRQGFIGYQLCAIMAQHWLISKACTTPAKDAVRRGYEVTINNGENVSPKIIDAMREQDVQYNINNHLIDFVRNSRIFGIRIAFFLIETLNPNEYYYKPFNIDGVLPGSYKGIVQIDPMWISPELDGDSSANPLSPTFYEPTWWRIGSLRIHRTHLIISRGDKVPDILKPAYQYGGLSLPQKIYERVYAAERTANEAPLLTLSKRTIVHKTDLTKYIVNQAQAEQRLQQMAALQTNYAVRLIGTDDELTQHETALADLDNVIMSQFQIVAAISNVPATKLLGTSPKGFNATGEFEEKNYHEELESIQSHDLTPFLDRHYLLLIKSEIAPRFNIEPFFTKIKWNASNALNAKEQAEINEIKSRTASNLINIGAVDGYDERQRIIADPSSDYTNLSEKSPEELMQGMENELGENENQQLELALQAENEDDTETT